MSYTTPGKVPLILLFLLALRGISASVTTDLSSTLPGRDPEAGNHRIAVETVKVEGRQLQVEGPACDGGIPGIQESDVCCPVSCETCAGSGCSSRDGGGVFSGQEACCGGGVRSLDRVCSDTVGAPCVVPSGPTCEGGIPGIQESDVCCSATCGTCAGSGCSSRDGGGVFSGQEACCGGGVRSLDRICSDTVGAPCVVSSGPTCEGGIPGIQESDVCCSATCGTCAGSGCSSRDGGGVFSGQESCCGGGVRSLDRICSEIVGAPCVVSSDFASTLMTWQHEGTDVELREAAEWEAVMSFEIPDSGGQLAQLFFSKTAQRLEALRAGASLYRVEYDANGDAVGVVLAGSEGRRSLQSEDQGDFHPPAWLTPDAVESAIESKEITCSKCQKYANLAAGISDNFCGNIVKMIVAVKDPRAIAAIFLACQIFNALSPFESLCEEVFCCERSRCWTVLSGSTCYEELFQECCEDGSVIEGNKCCPGLEPCGFGSDGDLNPVCFDSAVQRCCPRSATGPTEVVAKGECCGREEPCAGECIDTDELRCCVGSIFTAHVPVDECCPHEEDCGGSDGPLQCIDPLFLQCCGSQEEPVEVGQCCSDEEDCGIIGGRRWCVKPEDGLKCCGDGILPISLDENCPEETETKRGGSADGDPHMGTYDGTRYHCQGQGEFLFTKITATDSEVQVRFQQWPENQNPAVTVTTAVAAREGDSSVVQVSPAASGGYEVLVDGEPYDDAAATAATGVVLMGALPRVEMRFPSGLDVIVSTRSGGILSVNAYVPLALATTGLLGNNNEDLGDDWRTADGEPVEFASPSGPTVEEGTNYCTTNWCTTQESSIFTYAQGEDHGTYDLCDEVYNAPSLPEVVPTAVVELCGDNADCTFDALFAGDDVGRATLEGEEENRRYQEEVGGLCASNYFSTTGTPPCTVCPAGEVSGTGATRCTREEFLGLYIPEDIADAMVADAAGGFAGPGSLTSIPADPIVLSDSDLGAVSLSGTFFRDDGAALPSSASVFFYVDTFDDFVHGQGTLDSSTGAWSAEVTDIPEGIVSRLFLSFVVTDPAEALDATDAGPDTVFALSVANSLCDQALVIVLEWSDASVDLDLSITEPGGKLLEADKITNFTPGDAGWLYSDGAFDVAGAGKLEYYITSLGIDYTPVLGDYIARVNLFSGSNAAWRLTATIPGETAWTEEGTLTPFSPTSADFTASLTEYDSSCWTDLLCLISKDLC